MSSTDKNKFRLFESLPQLDPASSCSLICQRKQILVGLSARHFCSTPSPFLLRRFLARWPCRCPSICFSLFTAVHWRLILAEAPLTLTEADARYICCRFSEAVGMRGFPSPHPRFPRNPPLRERGNATEQNALGRRPQLSLAPCPRPAHPPLTLSSIPVFWAGFVASGVHTSK